MSATSPEPHHVYPERHFQEAVVGEIKSLLANEKYVLVRSFGLDIAVFFNQDKHRFIEVKSYGYQRGGIPFGNARGEGVQVDILLLPDASLALLDNSIRWVCADARLEKGKPRYAMLTNAEARSAAMAGVAAGKNNNFNVNLVMKKALTWDELSAELVKFLLDKEAGSGSGKSTNDP